MEQVVLKILGGVALFLVGLFSRNFLPGYIKRKGENLATKEDIEKITKITENTRAIISSRLYINQTRYIKEYDLLEELSEKVVDLYLAVIGLRPMMDYIDQGKNKHDIKMERINMFMEAGHKLYLLKERKKPFYPSDIYGKLKKLDSKSWEEVVSYKNGDSSSEYWKEALENRESIELITKEIIEAIKRRIQKWEKCDF